MYNCFDKSFYFILSCAEVLKMSQFQIKIMKKIFESGNKLNKFIYIVE